MVKYGLFFSLMIISLWTPSGAKASCGSWFHIAVAKLPFHEEGRARAELRDLQEKIFDQIGYHDEFSPIRKKGKFRRFDQRWAETEGVLSQAARSRIYLDLAERFIILLPKPDMAGDFDSRNMAEKWVIKYSGFAPQIQLFILKKGAAAVPELSGLLWQIVRQPDAIVLPETAEFLKIIPATVIH